MATVRTLIGYVKGPKGDKGDTGATGAQGPAGQNGAPGVTDYATTEAAGLVRVGDDLKINGSNGILSIKNMFTTASTLAKMVSEEAFAISLGKIAKAVDWVVDNAPNFFNKNTDIVDGFNSALTDKALSANAGKTLKTQLDSLNDSFSGCIAIKNISATAELNIAAGSYGTVTFQKPTVSGYDNLLFIFGSSPTVDLVPASNICSGWYGDTRTVGLRNVSSTAKTGSFTFAAWAIMVKTEANGGILA